jgi:hypothetical protein
MIFLDMPLLVSKWMSEACVSYTLFVVN